MLTVNVSNDIVGKDFIDVFEGGLDEASRVVVAYVDSVGLASSDTWAVFGVVTQAGKKIARIAYNGRVGAL